MGQGAQQQQQGGGQGNDQSLALMWIFALFFITAALIWIYFHEPIVAFVFKVKLYQAQLVYYFTERLGTTINIIQTTAPAQVTLDGMKAVSTIVGNYMRYPIMVLLGILAVILYASDVTLKFRKTYTMKRLLSQEKGNWPQIVPVTKLNLVEEDIDNGPWAMSVPPMEFAKKHNLLKTTDLEYIQGAARRPVPVAALRRGRAKRVFILQLGVAWEGFEKLPPHRLALMAIFAARANSDRDVAAQKLAQIAISTEKGKLNFSGCKSLLKKYYNTEKVQRVVQRHAYVLPMMASLIQEARRDGVLACADFLWLKPIDRPLWYMLNSIGRQTPFVEVSGVFAHWLVEKEMGRPLKIPMVDEAVKALELSIREIVYQPDENEKNKKTEGGEDDDLETSEM